eukprot:209191-Alexandrium_andersonii.AAC.1
MESWHDSRMSPARTRAAPERGQQRARLFTTSAHTHPHPKPAQFSIRGRCEKASSGEQCIGLERLERRPCPQVSAGEHATNAARPTIAHHAKRSAARLAL